MPELIWNGLAVPEPSDAVTPLSDLFRMTAERVNHIIPVTGPTHAWQVVDEAAATTVDPPEPIFVYREDEGTLWRYGPDTEARRLTPHRSHLYAEGGEVDIVVGSGDVPGRVGATVTFTPGRFTSPPFMMASLATGGVASLMEGTTVSTRPLSSTTVTNSGVWVYATTAGTYRVQWLAIGF